MRFSASLTIAFAALGAASGWTDSQIEGSWGLLWGGLLPSLALTALAACLWKGSLPCGYVTIGLTMLFGMYLGYRFAESGNLVSGVAFGTSFLLLFVLLLQMFLKALEASRRSTL